MQPRLSWNFLCCPGWPQSLDPPDSWVLELMALYLALKSPLYSRFPYSYVLLLLKTEEEEEKNGLFALLSFLHLSFANCILWCLLTHSFVSFFPANWSLNLETRLSQNFIDFIFSPPLWFLPILYWDLEWVQQLISLKWTLSALLSMRSFHLCLQPPMPWNLPEFHSGFPLEPVFPKLHAAAS
jgi:hypothetical protein